MMALILSLSLAGHAARLDGGSWDLFVLLQAKLQELVAASQPGDVLYFHFSGHGCVALGSTLLALALRC